ncbi:MAG TPA: methyltransferase domain-containing protein [Verrucomicrobiae bacterium]|jgi:demethylmenaquinone methyltransferase/2-methoxy-6-polyprenyl-1,4-benzoquinol methylase
MDALASYYARRAPEYERIYQKPERQADLRTLRKLAAEIFAERCVLEVACGTGWWTEILADCARSVVATDINEEVLAIAKARPMPASKVSFQRSDAFQLEEIEGEFDAALSAFWWSHLKRNDLERFLRVLHSRLQPGSRVAFIDNVYVEGSSTPISRRDLEGNTYQLRKLDDGPTTEVLKNFPTDDAIAEMLRDRADDLKIERLTYYWLARYTIRN